MDGQRSVTLFSSAAAICCRRKANCIFWAAGSSSKALMIWVGMGEVGVEMDTEETCQITGPGVGTGRLPCTLPQGPRTYLVIVLLCVLVELVQCHKCVQRVCVCLWMTAVPTMKRGYRSPKASPTEQQAVRCWLGGNITDTPVEESHTGEATSKARACGSISSAMAGIAGTSGF